MITPSLIAQVGIQIERSRGLPSAAHFALVQTVLSMAGIDPKDYFAFAVGRLDRFGKNESPSSRVASDSENRLMKRVTPFLVELRKAVADFRLFMENSVDPAPVEEQIRSVRKTYDQVVAGSINLIGLIRALGCKSRHDDDVLIRPIGSSGIEIKKSPSICCQIRMTCDTDADDDLGQEPPGGFEYDRSLQDLEVFDRSLKPTDISSYEKSAMTLGECHIFHWDDRHFLFVMSPPGWYRISDEIASFVREARHSSLTAAATKAKTRYGVSILDALSPTGILVDEKTIQAMVPEHHLITALQLHTTHRCNMRCTYCYAGDGSYGGSARDMDISTAKRAVDLLMARSGEAKEIKISFFGGEPLLNLNLIKSIVPYARGVAVENGKKLLLSVTTNGLLLREEVRHYLNTEGIGVLVSLDGPRDIHDRYRKTKDGAGTYDVIARHLENQAATGRPFKIRATHFGIEDDIRLIYDHFNRMPVSRGFAYHRSNPGKAYFEKSTDLLDRILAEEMTVLYQTGDIRLSPFFKALQQIDVGELSDYPCGAGRNFFAVAPGGNLYMCHRFMFDERFCTGSVWDEFSSIKANKIPGVDERPGCKNCWARYYCGGQCYRECDEIFEDISRPDSAFCLYSRKRIECATVLASALYDRYDKESGVSNPLVTH